MFNAWNICDCGLDQDTSGHHYWETKALADELLRSGQRVRIFSHRRAPSPENFPGVEIVPAFTVFLYGNASTDPIWSTLENFVVHNRSFHSDLAAQDRSLFQGALNLFPTLGEKNLLGLFRWLEDFPAEQRPKVAACMIEPPDWSETDHSTRLYKSLWERCPPAVRNNIAIFARTPQNAAMFKKYASMPAQIFPFVIAETQLAGVPDPIETPECPMVVAFLGGTRRRKGTALIADVARQCRNPEIQFFIQVNSGYHPANDALLVNDLAGLAHVRVHRGPLPREDYYRAIAGSVVLLPYMPEAYRWKDSGIYREAKHFGAPVLVPAGTWMADEVARLGNGLIIEQFSAAAVVDCILRARQELPALKTAAARVRANFREANGAARCIGAIAGAFEHAVAV